MLTARASELIFAQIIIIDSRLLTQARRRLSASQPSRHILHVADARLDIASIIIMTRAQETF